MVMILGSGHATVVPPTADINRRLSISIATRPALNWDHRRRNAGKNIMPVGRFGPLRQLWQGNNPVAFGAKRT
jgi:hypothetical protein